jgi:hypothetical protein
MASDYPFDIFKLLTIILKKEGQYNGQKFEDIKWVIRFTSKLQGM